MSFLLSRNNSKPNLKYIIMHLKLSIKIKILKYGSVNNPSESNRTLTCCVNPNLLTIHFWEQADHWARQLITDRSLKYPNIHGVLSVGWQLVHRTMLLLYPIYKTFEQIFYIIPTPYWLKMIHSVNRRPHNQLWARYCSYLYDIHSRRKQYSYSYVSSILLSLISHPLELYD